jgi:hypothetical protein
MGTDLEQTEIAKNLSITSLPSYPAPGQDTEIQLFNFVADITRPHHQEEKANSPSMDYFFG